MHMEKLGPGSNLDTLQALALVPCSSFDVIVDAGCGTGRQTLVLAHQLESAVHAVDISEQHLSKLERYAKELGMEHLVHTHAMDMADLPTHFPAIDLLWSECSAYHIGFRRALETWFKTIRPGGHAVVSELSWLRPPEDVPPAVRQYFGSGYPEMCTVEENISFAEAAGYEVIASHLLSHEAWIEGYYDRLEPLAHSLLHHSEAAVRVFAQQSNRPSNPAPPAEPATSEIDDVPEQPE